MRHGIKGGRGGSVVGNRGILGDVFLPVGEGGLQGVLVQRALNEAIRSLCLTGEEYLIVHLADGDGVVGAYHVGQAKLCDVARRDHGGAGGQLFPGDGLGTLHALP